MGGVGGLGCADVGVDGTHGAGGSGDAHAITVTIALNAWMFIGLDTFTSVVITANVFPRAIFAFGDAARRGARYVLRRAASVGHAPRDLLARITPLFHVAFCCFQAKMM